MMVIVVAVVEVTVMLMAMDAVVAMVGFVLIYFVVFFSRRLSCSSWLTQGVVKN